MSFEHTPISDNFPEQSPLVGDIVEVTRITESGTEPVPAMIVRDDAVLPLVRITELEDGSIVMGDEAGGYLEPLQGLWRGKRAAVIFDYDTENQLTGKIVRDDMSEPHSTVIKLDMGHFILGTECQFRPLDV